MKRFKTRWQEGGGKEFVDRLVYMGRSGNGFNVLESPFGMTEDGLLDFRGLCLPETAELRRVSFGPADFSASSWARVWLERSRFDRADFAGASFQVIGDHGNEFLSCRFSRTSFRGGVLGYRGSRFVSCAFDRADFSRALFVRPEFDDCEFRDCKLNGCDFNGASFERCRFMGELRDVWFRGGFALPADMSEYGVPRANRMTDVSFEGACLREATFSNGCDLSSVRIPKDGYHQLCAQWSQRLKILQEIARTWGPEARSAGSAFAAIHLVHARTQDWFILNRRDLDEEYGRDVADLIWQSLVGTP